MLDSLADSFARFSHQIYWLDLLAGFAHWILSLILLLIHLLDSLADFFY